MKLTDLKIGDWVLFEGNVSKVISLSEKVSQLESKDEDEYFASFNVGEDITPIPITKEILEKNGYEQGLGIDECSYSYSKDDLYLEYHRDENKIYFQDFYRSVNYKEIKYVHELQHILWALGYDDDIEL